ncbi:MAG: hypothetical protein ACRDTA_05775 [Pseudonocardiaceae bacterium]
MAIEALRLRPAQGRWGDVEGAQISLFCWVEQVMEDPEPGVLPSRLYARGQVVGRGLDSLYVCFSSDNALVSLPPRLLRLLSDAPASDPAPVIIPLVVDREGA